MFGIDFSEFLVIGVVALIVLGPERLPKVARTLGHLLGRFQRYAADVKEQVKREMEAEDLKKLHTQFQEVKEAAGDMRQTIHREMSQTETEVRQAISPDPGASLEFAEPATPSQPEPEAPSPQLELPLLAAHDKPQTAPAAPEPGK